MTQLNAAARLTAANYEGYDKAKVLIQRALGKKPTDDGDDRAVWGKHSGPMLVTLSGFPNGRLELYVKLVSGRKVLDFTAEGPNERGLVSNMKKRLSTIPRNSDFADDPVVVALSHIRV